MPSPPATIGQRKQDTGRSGLRRCLVVTDDLRPGGLPSSREASSSRTGEPRLSCFSPLSTVNDHPSYVKQHPCPRLSRWWTCVELETSSADSEGWGRLRPAVACAWKVLAHRTRLGSVVGQPPTAQHKSRNTLRTASPRTATPPAGSREASLEQSQSRVCALSLSDGGFCFE